MVYESNHLLCRLEIRADLFFFKDSSTAYGKINLSKLRSVRMPNILWFKAKDYGCGWGKKRATK